MNFFILRPFRDELFGALYAYADTVDPATYGDANFYGRCRNCAHGLGMLPWLPPQRYKLSSAQFGDFLWGAGFSLMVSERFVSAYHDAGLTGVFQFDPPATLVAADRQRFARLGLHPPAYRNVHIVHGGADLDDVKSGAVRKHLKCELCRLSIDGLSRIVFKPNSWTGYDIFEANGLPGSIVVTEKSPRLRHSF